MVNHEEAITGEGIVGTFSWIKRTPSLLRMSSTHSPPGLIFSSMLKLAKSPSIGFISFVTYSIEQLQSSCLISNLNKKL